MRTLIFNASPKKDGDTVALIYEFTKYLNWEMKIISFHNDIKPCNDCRFCWNNEGCSINDEMQEIYTYIEDGDNIAIASPIWSSSLSGIVLILGAEP